MISTVFFFQLRNYFRIASQILPRCFFSVLMYIETTVKLKLSCYFYMQVSTIQELVTGYEASLRTCDLFGPCGKFLCIDSCLNDDVITVYGS